MRRYIAVAWLIEEIRKVLLWAAFCLKKKKKGKVSLKLMQLCLTDYYVSGGQKVSGVAKSSIDWNH